MMQTSIRVFTITILLVGTSIATAAPVSFTGLGFVPDRETSSRANAVSADGSVVVGSSTGPAGQDIFLWTAGGGMVSLGDLLGGSINAEAMGVSSDGSVIVGFGTNLSG